MTQLSHHETQPQDAEHYIPFVRKIAGRIARRVPRSLELDDLVAAGTVGLMEALHRYDPAGGRGFETYAEFRVKGAMLDELRRHDPLNRAARTTASRIAAKTAQMTAELGRVPNTDEVADAMQIASSRVGLAAALSVTSVDTQNFEIGDETPTQEQQVAKEQLVKLLQDEIGKLPKRQQLVLSLCYLDDVSQVQAAEILGVTESRVSQILSQTRKRLRRRLEIAVR